MTWNPRVYIIDERARSRGEPKGWRVRRHLQKLQEGDRFALWCSGRGGIAATGHITGEAEFTDPPSPENWREPPGKGWYVPLVVDSWHDCVIPFRTLRDDRRFDTMSFRKVPGASNPHPLTEAEWNALMSYL